MKTDWLSLPARIFLEVIVGLVGNEGQFLPCQIQPGKDSNRCRREASMASDRDYVVQSPAGGLASSMVMAGETICD